MTTPFDMPHKVFRHQHRAKPGKYTGSSYWDKIVEKDGNRFVLVIKGKERK